MANRFVRGIRDVRDIEKQRLFTNEVNDLLHTKDDKTYIRLNKTYERITGLPELENTFYGFKKQIERKTDNTQKKLNDYIKNNSDLEKRLKDLEELENDDGRPNKAIETIQTLKYDVDLLKERVAQLEQGNQEEE